MIRCVLIIMMTSVVAGPALRAQEPEAARPPRTTEEMNYELEVERAQIELDKAETERDTAQTKLDETQVLYDEGIVPLSDLERDQQALWKAKLSHELAENSLSKTRLQFLTDALLITIVDAKKVRDENDYRIDITLRNDSDFRRAEVAVKGIEQFKEHVPERLLDVDNLSISMTGTVKLEGGNREVIVVYPYEFVVPKLRFGEEKTIRFELLRKEVEAVKVVLEYQDVKVERQLLLGAESAADFPTIEVRQFNRKGRLGGTVQYEISLNRLARSDQAFSLIALNLPPEFSYSFKEEAGGEVSQVKFSQDVQTIDLTLEVPLQKKLDIEFIDQQIEFSVFVTRASELKEINALRQKHPDRPIPFEELSTIRGDRADLILIPQGRGELEITIANSLKEVNIGEPIEMRFTVVNTGTLPLRKVTPSMEPPPEWEVAFEPKSAAEIEAGDRKVFNVIFTAPPGVDPGKLHPKIKVVGYTGTETITALPREVEISLEAPRNITAMLVLVGVLIGLVLIIAIASIKISRR